jgi:hypothetical protein
MNRKVTYLFLLFCFFLTGADQGGIERDERAALREQRAKLQRRVDALRREQDFLLFQKAMFSSDSRYLVINPAKKTGQLKYKNRVLKDFRFQTSKNFRNRAPRPGMLTLTKKTEGAKGRHALVFGGSLIVQWKRTAVPKQEAAIPFLSLTRKELQSIFYAVEEGAPAYIMR